jgi:hypothetical protein
MNTRAPNAQEQRRWSDFYNHVDRVTLRLTKGSQNLGGVALKMRSFLESLGVSVPSVIDDNDLAVLKDIANREAILQRLLAKLWSKQYCVSFTNGTLDIVAQPGAPQEAVQADIYPAEGTFGIAPVIVIAAIAGITLLIAGDQAADRLDKEAKVEALKLQQKMIAADQAMATADPAAKASYEKWKAQNAANFNRAVENLVTADSREKGFIERFLGTSPTMALIIGGLLIGGAVAFAKSRKSGD